MSNSFTEQLQKNATTKSELKKKEIQEQQDLLEKAEINKFKVYDFVIEKIKSECIVAVRNGNFDFTGSNKVIEGNLFFGKHYTNEEYGRSFDYINCEIPAIYDIPSSQKLEDFFEQCEILTYTWKYGLEPECYDNSSKLFPLIRLENPLFEKSEEYDISSKFEKLIGKRTISHRNVDDKVLLNEFVDYFEKNVDNSKITNVFSVTKTLRNTYGTYNEFRQFRFEIKF